VLVMGRTRPTPFFDAGQLKIARMVADYLGIVVALGELQKRRASEQLALRDLEIAAQIQLSLMPQEFSVAPGLDLYGTCRPALKSGGDYFDILILPDQSLLCVMADVMGKGLSAALLATMLRTNLHAIVASGITDPGEIIAGINRLMSRDLIKLEMFLTMVCVWISADRSEIRHASAGHLSLLLQKQSGEIVEIEGSGMPVGIFRESSYKAESHPFALGDRLLFYTDGITEATGDGDALLDEVARFSGKRPPSDDRTIILVSRTT
jgi:serine phosphatase RsbU (regulator of sigma subunit)